MKKETLYNIENLLCKTLEEYKDKDRLGGSGELQYLDTVLHAMKNLYKIMDEFEGGESSYRSMSDGNTNYSRRGSSYADGGSYGDGSYRGYSRDEGSYRRGRDSRTGRYVSRSGGDMIERLHAMMNEAEDPEEREELRKFIENIERRG